MTDRAPLGSPRDDALAPLGDPSDARDLTRAVTTTTAVPKFRRCTYCGHPCYGAACNQHQDLIRLDPNRSLSDHTVKEARRSERNG